MRRIYLISIRIGETRVAQIGRRPPKKIRGIDLLSDHLETQNGGGPLATPQRAMLWGRPVATTSAIVANTALVGAFQIGAQLFYRSGLRLEASNAHSDFFVRSLVCIPAELRAALAVYRSSAFRTRDGPHVETGKGKGYGLTAVTAAHTYREPPQSRPGGQPWPTVEEVGTQIVCHGQSQYECGVLQHRTHHFPRRDGQKPARGRLDDSLRVALYESFFFQWSASNRQLRPTLIAMSAVM